MNLNKVELIGNLVRDPAVKSLPTGLCLARLTIATQHAWRDQKTKKVSRTVEYHPILAWGKLGETIGKYLRKGDKIYLEGRLQTREWQDERKIKRHETQVIASNLIMLGSKKKSDKTDEIVVEEIDARNQQ